MRLTGSVRHGYSETGIVGDGLGRCDQSFDASLLHKNRLRRTIGFANVAGPPIALVSRMQRGGNCEARYKTVELL